jgi:hypothetical protein
VGFLLNNSISLGICYLPKHRSGIGIRRGCAAIGKLSMVDQPMDD